MATRAFTQNTNLTEKAMWTSTVVLAASDDTAIIDVSRYTKCLIYVTCASFSSGNITVTGQSSADDTNFVTLDTAETVSATGTVLYGTTNLPIDITPINYLKFTRGGDSNTGTISIRVVAANKFGV